MFWNTNLHESILSNISLAKISAPILSLRLRAPCVRRFQNQACFSVLIRQLFSLLTRQRRTVTSLVFARKKFVEVDPAGGSVIGLAFVGQSH